MLSGDGNENSQKEAVGLISKKKRTLLVQHTFLDISLPFFGTTTTRNFRGCLNTEPELDSELDSFSLSRNFHALQFPWPLTGGFSWQSWKLGKLELGFG